SGRGHLYSWTTAEHQVHPGFPVPYTVVLVQLDDVPARFIGYLPGEPELREGQPMEVWFESLEDGVVLPQWRPVASRLAPPPRTCHGYERFSHIPVTRRGGVGDRSARHHRIGARVAAGTGDGEAPEEMVPAVSVLIAFFVRQSPVHEID